MKLWVDDVRPAPEGYIWCQSVIEAKGMVEFVEDMNALSKELFDDYREYEINIIDIDHDAGNYAKDGGDYINILNWLEETGRNYPIRIHSMNPVGVENMRRIIQRNGWTEVK